MDRKSKPYRNESGSLLIMTMFFACAFVTLTLVGMSFASIVYVQNRLQSTADSIAMAGATKLNQQDRAGQMNNMVKRCRQLVFSSRVDYKDACSKHRQVADLARSLLEEAQDSAEELDQERTKLAKVMKTEATEAVESAFRDRQQSLEITLPWLKQRGPFVSLQFGDLKNEFRISKLPSSVHGEMPVGHLASNDQFDPIVGSDHQLPSSCQVQLRLLFSGNSLPGTSEYPLSATSVSITSGSRAEQE